MITRFIVSLWLSPLSRRGRRNRHPRIPKKRFSPAVAFGAFKRLTIRPKELSKLSSVYTGGSAEDATYEKVSSHRTKHREALEVTMTRRRFPMINSSTFSGEISIRRRPTAVLRYRPKLYAAVYYGSDEEKKIAENSKEKLGKSGKFSKPIVTEILPATPFYPAEDYHQKYYLKKPADYEAYHAGSGREKFFKKTWNAEKKK